MRTRNGIVADLGYTVNFDAADVYRIPGTTAAFGAASLRVGAPSILTAPGWERPHRIGARITTGGRVTPVADTPERP